MKYKVGDKVKIKSKDWWDAQPKNESGSVQCGADTFNEFMTSMCGKVVEISDMSEDTYLIKGFGYNWTDEMFEDLPQRIEKKPTISDQMMKDIAEVIKKHNLGVCVSENEGKLIIEPLDKEKNEKEEFELLESGIYGNEGDSGVSVVFGGKIHVAIGTVKPNSYCIGLQELNGIYECGAYVYEEWVKNRPTVNLIINNNNTIKILRDALDIIEKRLNG